VSPGEGFVTWLRRSTVCMDQVNDVEKGLQIQKMAAIYDQAFHVCARLGTGTKSSAISTFMNAIGSSLPSSSGFTAGQVPGWATQSLLSESRRTKLKLSPGFVVQRSESTPYALPDILSGRSPLTVDASRRQFGTLSLYALLGGTYSKMII
jgi:Heterokaryon incompatibility protein (HET)